MIQLSYFIVLSAALFTIGIVGVLIRRNAILILLSIELMLNAVNINLVAFSHYLQSMTGQIFVFFIITVAAAEAAMGLAIIMLIFRGKAFLNVDEINILKW